MTENQIFAEWVILELMGHRRLAGFLTEQEIAGRGFLRLDVPGEPTNTVPAATQLYNPASVYCVTPTTEAIARAVAATSRPAPVQQWELPPFLRSQPTTLPVEDMPGELAAAADWPNEGPF
jgi:hypothetical protein